MEHTLKPGCVVLAAGGARRFGGGKLSARLAGRSLIRRCLEAIPPEKFQRVTVVARDPEILRLAESFRFSAVRNLRPEDGVSRSIALGLTDLGDCPGALFTVGDQPLLRRETVARLVDAWQAQPERIAALSHGGVRGNPCLFPARLFPELLALEGDQGGSAVIRRHPGELLLVEAPAEELRDVDTPQDLEALASELSEIGR